MSFDRRHPLEKPIRAKHTDASKWTPSGSKYFREVSISDILESGGDIADPASESLEIEDRNARKNQIEIIQLALRGLSPEHRQLLDLHYREGLNFATIARKLGKAPSSVHSMHVTALTRVYQGCRLYGLDCPAVPRLSHQKRQQGLKAA